MFIVGKKIRKERLNKKINWHWNKMKIKWKMFAIKEKGLENNWNKKSAKKNLVRDKKNDRN